MLARLALIVAVVVSTGVALAQDVVFPDLTGRVVDNAEVLSASQERTLTDWLTRHEDDTTNQVVVVTVTSLQDLEIEDYGYQLGRHWGIGQADHDNGVLLIVAPEERKVRIEVGYGLEGALTDAESRIIIDRYLLPAFRAGDYGDGIKEAVPAILAEIGDEEFTRESLNQSGLSLLDWMTAIVVVAICLFPLYIAFSRLFSDSAAPPDYRTRGMTRRRDRQGSFGGRGGGGFSGGGGSFGGGGASGSW